MHVPQRQQPRLLPWADSEDKPCYLIGDGGGPISRLADEVEATQLEMAVELLGHARAMLHDRRVSNGELRFLGERFTESLRDVLRIAESLGAQVPAAAEDQWSAPEQGRGAAKDPG
ncbi:hypothetical protein SAMN05428945_2815 [Streptomyces sp. 2224.1]|nr:hypothetical protein BX261_2503 [Streptomyces sp. 2321.6]SDR48598.1 hypothetical protein SAMN05216511_4700 [Streptomyces sp. KS_16]SEC40586.1 hypothetical protein SAMN05428945_2815 [Streptomyces sp. 2224.1]SEC64370.1 hypothetical protein SAMN05428940_2506 [Streptomyces sp. 2133.1]SEE95211.1 hypothetical protein SAMN05428954_4738 [Streptomyces sp. 2112.3]SNC68675.1 hypothetical protein SAMN06272741_2500 [Streptomyces sp. 2114.4]